MKIVNGIAMVIGWALMASGGLFLLLLIEEYVLDKIARAFHFHEFMIEQMGPWLRNRNSKRDTKA